MEIVLQHNRTGLFACGPGEWSRTSSEARAFHSTTDASRFAIASDLMFDVRLVVRIKQEAHCILMPLLGAIVSENGIRQRSARGSGVPSRVCS
jgi:hypothetical protein